MAANQPAGSVSSFSNTATVREDLADAIYMISPMDTYCLSNFGRGTADATLHQWQEDNLKDAVATNYVGEGADFSAITAATPLRVKNYTQISTKEIVVTGTQLAAKHAGLKNLLAYAVMKAGKELKRDIESSILSKNSATAGAVNSPRISAGIITYCETSLMIKHADQTGATCTAWAAGGIPNSSATLGASSTAITAAELNTALQVAWTNGGETDVILTTAALRQSISILTGIATRFSDVARSQEAVITNSADVFVSQFGAHKLVTSRYATAGVIYCLQTDMWSVDYLRGFTTEQIAKSGDSEKRLLLAEWTLTGKNHTSTTILVNRA